MVGLRTVLFCVTLLSLTVENSNGDNAVWTWVCSSGFCQKERLPEDVEAVSLQECQLMCLNYAALWPQPTGDVSISTPFVQINANSIDVLESGGESFASGLVRAAGKRFQKQIELLATSTAMNSGGKSIIVTLQIGNPTITRLAIDTDESYSMRVGLTFDGRVNATISAPTFFGSRHGLETLNQLIIYDDIRDILLMPSNVHITDKPTYGYRGILLDTARNFISVASIKRTLDGMASSKLNTFHWHITDSHSFPYYSKSRPQLSKIGAYTKKQIYSNSDVMGVIEYGAERGIRVLPEFDAPAHVGEGWQDTDFVACFNIKPWENYCVEPPCGQFDPTKSGLYDYLEDIYGDMIEQFNPDIFHMGGDEVSMTCWNTTSSIVNWMKTQKGWGRTEADFMKLWDVFQSQALERLDKKAGKQLPIIMWTSTLTKPEYVKKYLPNNRYIIQIWTTGNDKQVKDLLERDYRLILSNYDALYLDCGYAGWVQGGHNWCSPYIGWQTVYDNSPKKIGGTRSNQIMGAEAALWTEQVDDTAVDNRLWPRAAAMAERLWAEPATNWRAAESRMLIHRQRLVIQGIAADALEPQWCLQYSESCPIGGEHNRDF